MLAYQYVHADIDDKAIAYLTKAGEQAQKTYANQDAVRYYTQALAILPEDDLHAHFDILAARTTVYDAMSARPEQLADTQAMLALSGMAA